MNIFICVESSVLYSGFVLSGSWNHWYYDTPLGGVVTGKELVLSVSSSEEGYSPPGIGQTRDLVQH